MDKVIFSQPIISDMEALPKFSRLLNEVLPKDMRGFAGFVALETGDASCELLVNPSVWGSHDMHGCIKVLTRAGFKVDASHRCDDEILSALINHDVRSKEASDSHGDSDAIKDFDTIVSTALTEGASDIHWERRDSTTLVKMRIFGELFQTHCRGVTTETGSISNDSALNIVRVGLTVLGDEGNKPQVFSMTEMQQGSITRVVNGITVKLRAQTVPAYTITGDGQDVIMRVLPMSGTRTQHATLEGLGYFPEQVEMLENAKTSPIGALVIAGVTGSGKSTTLDNLLRGIIKETRGRKKVFTVEDPNEFILFGATQIPVARRRDDSNSNPFADAMRAAMRGDPDYIMVGEVRDEQSAQLLQRMVMSGHSVLTTLHTGSALKIPMRLNDLGIDRGVLGSPNFFSALVYQRLLQTICPHCSTPYMESDLYRHHDNARMVERLKRITGNELDGIRVRGEGCQECKGRGITGRTVCAEVVQPDYKMLDFFREGRETDAIRHWRGDTGILKSSLGSAVRKMGMGLIDPNEFEDAYGKGAYLSDLEI